MCTRACCTSLCQHTPSAGLLLLLELVVVPQRQPLPYPKVPRCLRLQACPHACPSCCCARGPCPCRCATCPTTPWLRQGGDGVRRGQRDRQIPGSCAPVVRPTRPRPTGAAATSPRVSSPCTASVRECEQRGRGCTVVTPNVPVQAVDEVLVRLCVVCTHALAQRQLEQQAAHLRRLQEVSWLVG